MTVAVIYDATPTCGSSITKGSGIVRVWFDLLRPKSAFGWSMHQQLDGVASFSSESNLRKRGVLLSDR